MLMEMNRYLSFTLFTGLSLLTTIPIEAYTLNPNKTATSILQTNVIEVRSITSVQPIVIYCPVGTVPQLPYQVWVTYSDGQGEYRQTKWSNSALSTEQSEADDKVYPIGSQYTINGFIIGDDTTENGYPITAKIEVVDTKNTISPKLIAHTIPLNNVKINGNNRLTSNRDLAIKEIISWDVSQQLYNYRDTYGLSTEGYTRSDGWDSPETKLKGHGSGHYMSALALAYAAATNPSHKEILRRNITRMVNELRECQERTFVWSEELGRYLEARDFAPEEELKKMKGTWEAFDEHKTKWATYGYGYLNAIPPHHPALIEMYRAYNNSDWVWAPYYSIHKQLAGLIDIATYMDDKSIADKALLIAKDMGLWVWNRMHYRTYVKKDGTQEERRTHPGNRYEMWNMYIAGEVGGMGESLARLSEMVSAPEEKARLIEASNCFDSPAFYEPLSKNIDDIRNRHANQHIPMIIGALRSYLSNNDTFYYHVSHNFWNLIQGRYRYSTGGVGNGEMFRQPYTQIVSMAMNGVSEGESHSNPHINETCCAYNLLKLTKDLNCFNPDDARYMDYYERTLYNQIIGSLHPEHYQTTYQYAVGLNGISIATHYQPCSYAVIPTRQWKENDIVEITMPFTKHIDYGPDKLPAEIASKDGHQLETAWVGTLMHGPFAMTATDITNWTEATLNIDSRLASITVVEPNGPQTGTTGNLYTLMQGGRTFQPDYYRHDHTTHYFRINHIKDPTVELKMALSAKLRETTAFSKSHYTKASFAKLTTAIQEGEKLMKISPLTETTISTCVDNIDKAIESLVASRLDKSNLEASIHIAKKCNPDLYTTDSFKTLQATLESAHEVMDNIDLQTVIDKQTLSLQDATASLVLANNVDKTELKELLNIAMERQTNQEKWNALAVKIPEFAPWAHFGFTRLKRTLEHAQNVYFNKDKNYSQGEVNAIVASLNTVINTMRPGNLPEMEDLRPLSALLRRVGTIDDSTDPTLKDAVAFTEMVIKYVADGSGTHDMIETAISRLKSAAGL